jgi:hypothetical protein
MRDFSNKTKTRQFQKVGLFLLLRNSELGYYHRISEKQHLADGNLKSGISQTRQKQANFKKYKFLFGCEILNWAIIMAFPKSSISLETRDFANKPISESRDFFKYFCEI